MKNQLEIINESGTHVTIRLPVEGHNLIVAVDKKDFTITIPYFEYMHVFSFVKVIAQLYKDNNRNPVINNFLKMLSEPVNSEEFENFQIVSREFPLK